jgi:hypothetical protein
MTPPAAGEKTLARRGWRMFDGDPLCRASLVILFAFLHGVNRMEVAWGLSLMVARREWR